MVTCGGATLGYDSTPMLSTAITPDSEIRIAMTHAKIGWWMKNLDMADQPSAESVAAGASAAGGCDDGASSPAGAWPSAGAAPAGAWLPGAGAWPAAPGGGHGTALAGAPSVTFCRPETMTCAPSCRPPVTIQLPPSARSRVMSWRATLPSAPITIT